jgi:hypothetical protein
MEPTNQGSNLGGSPNPFSSWGDVGAPHMATLSLPGLTIGLPVWLFSTNVVQIATNPEQSNQQSDQSRATHQPSTSYNSSSDPSSSQGRAGKSQPPMEKKEKKKREKKQKEPMAKATGGKQKTADKNPHTAPTGPKSPCVICKGTHFHRDCPCIPRILRDWSPRLHNPVASTSDSHVDCSPSTSESEGRRGRPRSPCMLCEGDHAIHRCPFLDEAKRVLEDRPVSPLRLPPGYQKLAPNPSIVENPADPLKWSAEVSVIENEPTESRPDESLKVETAVDPVLPSEVSSSMTPSLKTHLQMIHLHDTLTEENKDDTIQVLFINTDSDEHQGNAPIPLSQEGTSSGSYPAVYSVPPPSNLVVSFDWNQLGRPRLPASIPFRIIVQIYRMVMAGTIIDEGASVSILSSIAWKALGSPALLPEMRNLSGFDKGTSRPLGILPNVPVTLKGKTVHMNVMVVQGPLDYNLLLGRDYIYCMEAIVSSLFRVMCFPHEGRMVKLVDQLSFPGSRIANSQIPSLNGLFTQDCLHPRFYFPMNASDSERKNWTQGACTLVCFGQKKPWV